METVERMQCSSKEVLSMKRLDPYLPKFSYDNLIDSYYSLTSDMSSEMARTYYQ